MMASMTCIVFNNLSRIAIVRICHGLSSRGSTKASYKEKRQRSSALSAPAKQITGAQSSLALARAPKEARALTRRSSRLGPPSTSAVPARSVLVPPATADVLVANLEPSTAPPCNQVHHAHSTSIQARDPIPPALTGPPVDSSTASKPQVADQLPKQKRQRKNGCSPAPSNDSESHFQAAAALVALMGDASTDQEDRDVGTPSIIAVQRTLQTIAKETSEDEPESEDDKPSIVGSKASSGASGKKPQQAASVADEDEYDSDTPPPASPIFDTHYEVIDALSKTKVHITRRSNTPFNILCNALAEAMGLAASHVDLIWRLSSNPARTIPSWLDSMSDLIALPKVISVVISNRNTPEEVLDSGKAKGKKAPSSKSSASNRANDVKTEFEQKVDDLQGELEEYWRCPIHSTSARPEHCWPKGGPPCYPITMANMRIWALWKAQGIATIKEKPAKLILTSNGPRGSRSSSHQDVTGASAPYPFGVPQYGFPPVAAYNMYAGHFPPQPQPQPQPEYDFMDIDFPLIENWLKELDACPIHGKYGLNFTQYTSRFQDRKLFSIDQLADSERIKVSNLAQWCQMEGGVAAFILCYAAANVKKLMNKPSPPHYT
ncbi:hypothetical protein FRC05_004501 [Tulasnella sp. 425]|nr:hypothetical protein FRC05_004501 [Tulasnella sp. 425]